MVSRYGVTATPPFTVRSTKSGWQMSFKLTQTAGCVVVVPSWMTTTLPLFPLFEIRFKVVERLPAPVVLRAAVDTRPSRLAVVTEFADPGTMVSAGDVFPLTCTFDP